MTSYIQQKVRLVVLFVVSTFLLGATAIAQMNVSSPMTVAGPMNYPATTISNGGSILVASGGNWNFGGNITSADKGNDNAPTSTGRTETITFDGTGSYTNTGSFMVDGYAAASNQLSTFILPIGNGVLPYFVTIPANASATAAYFNGSGSPQTAAVAGNSGTATVYSPYIDMPSGFPAGSYTFSYPAGFSAAAYSSLLSSGNTSAGGTNTNTAYSLLANVANFAATSGSATGTLPTNGATQVYFAHSTNALPVLLVGFNVMANGCAANLLWQSATEVNSSYYAVEYGRDGIAFHQVAKVTSKNSAIGSAYNYTYPLNSGNNYFRLKLVDNDGRFSYSQTVAITTNGACTGGQIRILPNPVHSQLNILGLVTGDHLLLFDINGKQLIGLTATANSQTIDMNGYAKGTYLLRVEHADGNLSSVKVLKQ